MTEDDVQKSNGIFFVDIDTILVPDNNDRGYLKRNIEEIRKNYLEHRIRNWERDEFLELSDDELVTMESWDRTWVENLELIIRGKKIRMVLLSCSHMDSDHIKTIAKFTGLYGVDEVLEYQNHEELINTVTGYISRDHKNNERYAVLSRMDYRKAFGKNAIWIRPGALVDTKMIENKINYLMICDMRTCFAQSIGFRNRTNTPCPFYKVIFLDIDGVLNDEGENRSKGVVIDRNMVACLKYIVENTDAEIILSSSWKYAYYRFMEDGFESEDRHLITLREQFTNAGLEISGITPLSQESGCEARPFEIIEWLMMYKDIFSFVILDDDTFWQWGFLQRNVVTTQRYDSSRRKYDRYVKGLTMEHARKAVEILNDQGALIKRI